MKLPLFIARRIADIKTSGFSGFIIRMATVATALSVAVMIISAAVVTGFKDTIRNKMFSFWSHIVVAPYNPNPTSVITPEPITFDDTLMRTLKVNPGVSAVYPFASKPVIIKDYSGILEGVKLKGINDDYPLDENSSLSFEGQKINFTESSYSKDLIVSRNTLNRLDIEIGDTVTVYFLDPDRAYPSIRKLRIAGTFHTGMEEIDKNFALCDLRLIQRVSNWSDKDINGYQISVDNYKEADIIGANIYRHYLEPPLYYNSISDIYPNIYSWLDLMNTNTYIILFIMAIVAVVNLSTALLIFILERTRMIGILKSLGMVNKKIRQVFLYHAGRVAFKGIIYGSLAGIVFCLLQQYFHVVSLDETAYYMKYMPVKLVAWHVLAIDIGTLIFCVFIMMIPSLFVKKINTIKALRFK